LFESVTIKSSDPIEQGQKHRLKEFADETTHPNLES
jgi:hypothetical protein